MNFLDVKNEPYMKIKREILSSRRASVRAATSYPRLSLPSDREDIEMMQRELEHLRRRCSELTEEKSSIRLYIMLYSIVKYNVIFCLLGMNWSLCKVSCKRKSLRLG